MANLGVSGHRVLCDLEKIQHGINQALERFASKFSDEPLTILTSLAEGTDRLVVEQFRSREDSRVVVVLPLSTDEYLKDFQDDTSRKHFQELLDTADEVIEMPAVAERDLAYEAAGLYVIDHCDALICIWDGKEEQGRGGTGAIVQRARKRGIPIAWIHAGNRAPGTLEPTSLGAEQGKVTYENL